METSGAYTLPSTSQLKNLKFSGKLSCGYSLECRLLSAFCQKSETKYGYRTKKSIGSEKMTRVIVKAGESRPHDTVDDFVDGVSFGQLCDEFECISSPAVERTARQLARDLSELRENRRDLSCYAVNLKYKDPLRSFTGREKLHRPSWILNALTSPEVFLLEMFMQDTSHLVIRYRIKGGFPGPGVIAGPLSLNVKSTFVINQISGQVTEQEDEWDFEGSSPLAMATFYSSRLAWSTVEGSKDLSEKLSNISKALEEKTSDEIYVDPTDPRKFFQQSNSNSELFQIGFFLALLYLVVEYLKLAL